MIFLSNAEGVITAAIPEPINQGSVGVNRIVLIAPFPSTSVVSATFTLPNGIKIYPRYVGETYNRPYLMGVVEAFSDKMLTIDGVTVNAWQLTLDKAITSVAGNVTVQFLVTTAAGTTAVTDENGEEKTIGVIIPGTEQTLATTSATLPINRGNAYLAPSVSDKDLDTIAGYLAAAKQAKINAEAAQSAASKSAKAAADSATAASKSATAASNSATAASKSETAASNSATAAETAQEKAEEAANRASPWSLVATQANIYTVLQGLSSITAKSILFLNVDFANLDLNDYVVDNVITFVFHSSCKKVEFRGCNFGTRVVSLQYPTMGDDTYITGVNGGNVRIVRFLHVEDCICYSISYADSVINCNCHSVLSCDNITGTKASVFSSCNRISASEGRTFTNCTFVDPFTVKGFVPVIDNGKVPTISQSGGYVPKQLPAKIVLAVDDQYIVTATLKDVNDGVISTATIDLPLESVVVGATVSEDGKTLILKLQNGTTTKIPIENIFQGLATETWVNAQISDVNTTINGIGTRVTALENGLEAAETDISTLKEDMSAAETEIDELKTSKLDSAGLTHSCSEDRARVSLDVGAGGVVISSSYSQGEIKIGGYDGVDQISITYDDIAGIPYDDIARKGKVEALETQNTILKKRVDNIEGAAIDFVVDSTDAVTKTVPTDALPYAKIMKIGGKTYVEDTPDGFILKSAPVTELVSEGANLIPFPYTVGGVGTVIERHGITWTVNADGSITANGTATGASTFRLANANSFTLPKGNYILSGCPSGGSESSYYLTAGVYNNGVYVTEASDIGTGSILNVTDRTYTGISIDLAVKTGTVCNNLTFYPMLNKGSTALPYRPYSKRTFPIPESVRPLNGINANACDYIAWEADGTRKKHECIAIVEASSLDWQCDGKLFYTTSLANKRVFGKTNVMCTRYETTDVNHDLMENLLITGSDSNGVLYIRDDQYITRIEGGGYDAQPFQDSLAGVKIAYESKTPIVTDITDILTPDNYIEVEGGGTITAVNGGNGAPTTIYYATEKTGG